MHARNPWIGLLSAAIAGMMVYGIYVLQSSQIRMQEQVTVVAPKQFIDAGSMITEEMVEAIPLYKDALQEGMLVRKEDAVGKEAVIALGKGEAIFDWKISQFHLFPSAGQATFQIPKEYILSISSGVRAGDRVAVYASRQGEGSVRLFPEGISVASVKSAANMEIDDAGHTSLLAQARGNKEMLYAARRDANAPIDHINLNLTEAQWLTIDRQCGSEGARLVIAYEGAPGFMVELSAGEGSEPN